MESQDRVFLTKELVYEYLNIVRLVTLCFEVLDYPENFIEDHIGHTMLWTCFVALFDQVLDPYLHRIDRVNLCYLFNWLNMIMRFINALIFFNLLALKDPRCPLRTSKAHKDRFSRAYWYATAIGYQKRPRLRNRPVLKMHSCHQRTHTCKIYPKETWEVCKPRTIGLQ